MDYPSQNAPAANDTPTTASDGQPEVAPVPAPALSFWHRFKAAYAESMRELVTTSKVLELFTGVMLPLYIADQLRQPLVAATGWTGIAGQVACFMLGYLVGALAGCLAMGCFSTILGCRDEMRKSRRKTGRYKTRRQALHDDIESATPFSDIDQQRRAP